MSKNLQMGKNTLLKIFKPVQSTKHFLSNLDSMVGTSKFRFNDFWQIRWIWIGFDTFLKAERLLKFFSYRKIISTCRRTR